MTYLVPTNNLKVRFKKLVEKAQVPNKAHPTDAGFDLVATSRKSNALFIEYGTGLAIEIPKGYVGLIFPRSSVSKAGLHLCNSVGVIDSGYRGEIKLRFYKKSICHSTYLVGDRVGQLVIMPYPMIEFEECEELDQSDRGLGKFGSTGK